MKRKKKRTKKRLMSTLAKTSGRVRLCIHYDEEMCVYDLQCSPMSKEEFEIAARGAARAYARSFTQSMLTLARVGKARRERRQFNKRMEVQEEL